jgi:uncharacterized protein YceH (UPF0502 family)
VNLVLSPVEVRILGCLIEKQATTPDVYPLTLNSLLTACNQKTNREPVMELEIEDITEALATLMEATLASIYKSSHNRMEKYQHRLHQRAFDEFNFSTPELAVLCVLFLRGAQTPGEIRTRCARIHEFRDVSEVTGVLAELAEKPDGPYTRMLPRQAGRKESRYAHLFCGEPEFAEQIDATESPVYSQGTSRVAGLEQEIAALQDKLGALEQRFEDFVKQFE